MQCCMLMAGATPDWDTRFPFLTKRVSLAILAVVYLSSALTFSLLTRAWEADDEQAHTQYIEDIVGHDALPHISTANLQESHQPPLYYLLAAGWQELLGIPAFTPVVVQEHYKDPYIIGRLQYSHNYTATQRRDAEYLHELRLLSILLGLGTVLLTYAAAKVVQASEPFALSAGLIVALLPHELVVSTAVTNDALVIPLCALALVLYLLSERARAAASLGRRRLYVLCMGLTLGAAAATKFNSLPVAGVLFVLTLMPSITIPLQLRRWSNRQTRSATINAVAQRREWGVNLRAAADGLIAIIAFFAVSGWWFVRNKHLYGQFLATRASEGYLRAYLLHPIPWSTHLVVWILPRTLFVSTWYVQPLLPLLEWMNQALAVLGLLCLFAGAWVVLGDHKWSFSRLPRLSGLALIGPVVAGAIAVLITIKSTSIGDARIAFVGLSGFAILLVAGSTWLLSRISLRVSSIGLLVWPTILLSVDLYVLIHFLIPLGGL
jgi:hypothetical protein